MKLLNQQEQYLVSGGNDFLYLGAMVTAMTAVIGGLMFMDLYLRQKRLEAIDLSNITVQEAFNKGYVEGMFACPHNYP